MKAVHVTWVDSIVLEQGGWMDRDLCRELTAGGLVQQTVGWMVRETDEVLIIAAHRTDDGTRVAATTAIPRSAVTNLRELQWI